MCASLTGPILPEWCFLLDLRGFVYATIMSKGMRLSLSHPESVTCTVWPSVMAFPLSLLTKIMCRKITMSGRMMTGFPVYSIGVSIHVGVKVVPRL